MLPPIDRPSERPYVPPPPPPPPQGVPGYGSTPSYVGPTPTGKHLSDAQVKSESQRILDVGDRTLWDDDYDKRAREFAKTMADLDPASAQALFHQVLADDKGATHSWLSGGRIFDQTSDPAQRAAVVNAFAAEQARTGGDIYSTLDFISGGRSSSLVEGGPGLMTGAVDQVDAFLSAGDTYATDALRQSLGQGLLARYTDTQAQAFNPGAAALAVHIMSGSSDPTMVGRTFASLPQDQRAQVFSGLNEFGQTFARGGQPDPMVQLVDSVRVTGGYGGLYKTAEGGSYGDLAVELVRDADTGDSPVLFPDGNEHSDPARAAAFSDLFVQNRDAILNTMLDTRDMAFDPSSPDGKTLLVGQDGVALGNLMRATALESDNPQQQTVLSALSQYVGDQQRLATSGTPAEKDAAAIRLGGFAAVTTDAVSQLQTDITQDKEANAAMVSFVVDTALSAIPGGGAFGSQAGKVLTDVLGDNVMGRLSATVTGDIVDAATGQLTDDAKAKLTDLLGPDGEAVLDKTTLSNDLHAAIYAGAEDRGDVNDINAAFTTMRAAIEFGR